MLAGFYSQPHRFVFTQLPPLSWGGLSSYLPVEGEDRLRSNQVGFLNKSKTSCNLLYNISIFKNRLSPSLIYNGYNCSISEKIVLLFSICLHSFEYLSAIVDPSDIIIYIA